MSERRSARISPVWALVSILGFVRVPIAASAFVFALIAVSIPANATSDQECWYSLIGYDAKTKTLWKSYLCSGNPEGHYKLDLSSPAKTSDWSRMESNIQPDRESMARATPLVAIPAAEFQVGLENSAKHRGEIAEGETYKLVLVGENAVDSRFSLRLANLPRVAGAWLIPGTQHGVAEIRYGSHYGCCPSDGQQHYAVFEYRPKPVPRSNDDTPTPWELRIGPRYLALATATTRLQVTLPCATGTNKGVSAPGLSFDFPCKGGKKRLRVTRSGRLISVADGSTEVARLHLPTEQGVPKLVVEEMITSRIDTNSYREHFLLCTYSGRCSVVIDTDLALALNIPTKKLCGKEVCVMLPKRHNDRRTFGFERAGNGDIFTVEVPRLRKSDRVVGISEKEWTVRQRDGSEMLVPFTPGSTDN